MTENRYQYSNKIPFFFEDHFDYQKISPEHVAFARHFIENEMGIELDSDTLIEFSPIRSKVFGFLIAHLADEFEKYKSMDLDG
jgi:hypothetical protein